MKCEERQLNSDFVVAPVGSQVAREPQSDIFHGRAPVGWKLALLDFASWEVQKEADRERIAITTRGNMPRYENPFEESQIEGVEVCIRDLVGKR
jgi:hypothetical protein